MHENKYKAKLEVTESKVKIVEESNLEIELKVKLVEENQLKKDIFVDFKLISGNKFSFNVFMKGAIEMLEIFAKQI